MKRKVEVKVKTAKVVVFLLAWIILTSSLTSAFYLEWTQNGPVTSFEIQRKIQGGAYAVIAKPAAAARNYQDKDPTLKLGINYCYQIWAINGASKSSASAEQCSIAAGVRVYPKPGQTVSVIRRNTDGGSTVDLSVAASEAISQGTVPKAGSLVVDLRPNLTLNRTDSVGSTLVFTVDQSEIVTVDGKILTTTTIAPPIAPSGLKSM